MTSKGKELQNQRGISIRGITGDRSEAVSRKGRINIETAFKAESAITLFLLWDSPDPYTSICFFLVEKVQISN